MPTLTLLGRPLLVDDDGVVVTGRPAQRHCLALLALLAGERRGLSRDRIVAYLWPDSDASTARHRLSVALHVLRSRLGEPSIRSSGDGLELEAERWAIDAWRFDEDVASGEFAHALACWGRPPLEGFHLRGSSAFEQWLERWRDRLSRRHLAMLDVLAEQAELAGDLEAWVEHRQELTAREPCSGARALALMRSLAAAGRAEGAIRCARAYTLLVRDEYGLEPDPAVVACADTLVREGRFAGGTRAVAATRAPAGLP
jgi:DNA-binding SARP family transcriptional activator